MNTESLIKNVRDELEAKEKELYEVKVENYSLRDTMGVQLFELTHLKNAPILVRILWVFTGVKI